MSRRPIKDEFENLPVSRQRKYQLRKQRDGRCTECGAPVELGLSRCVKHLVKARERQRQRSGAERRYYTDSYRAQEAARKHHKKKSKPKTKAGRTRKG